MQSEVRIVEAEEVVSQAEVRVRIVVSLEIKTIGGQILKNMQITLLPQFVKNITSMGSLLTGVKSQQHVHGRTFSSLRGNNETVTSSALMTYKIHCITSFIRKYTLLTYCQTRCLKKSLTRE